MNRIKGLASKGRAFLAVAAGLAVEAVTAGVAHGVVLHVAQAVIAVATAAGAHVASTSFAAKAVADVRAAEKLAAEVKADAATVKVKAVK